MRDDLEKKLYEEFPSLYQQRKLSPRESCLAFGIETGAGWFSIIYDLSKKIMEIDSGVQASQVKEKFGGLRFYVSNVSRETADDVYALIDKAEELSLQTCELCGKTGEPNEIGWIITLCDECRETRNASRK